MGAPIGASACDLREELRWVRWDLRLIDSCITQLKVQGPSRTCNESKEEEKKTCASPRVCSQHTDSSKSHRGTEGTSRRKVGASGHAPQIKLGGARTSARVGSTDRGAV